jgi:hypothetical protein
MIDQGELAAPHEIVGSWELEQAHVPALLPLLRGGERPQEGGRVRDRERDRATDRSRATARRRSPRGSPPRRGRSGATHPCDRAAIGSDKDAFMAPGRQGGAPGPTRGLRLR